MRRLNFGSGAGRTEETAAIGWMPSSKACPSTSAKLTLRLPGEPLRSEIHSNTRPTKLGAAARGDRAVQPPAATRLPSPPSPAALPPPSQLSEGGTAFPIAVLAPVRHHASAVQAGLADAAAVHKAPQFLSDHKPCARSATANRSASPPHRSPACRSLGLRRCETNLTAVTEFPDRR